MCVVLCGCDRVFATLVCYGVINWWCALAVLEGGGGGNLRKKNSF